MTALNDDSKDNNPANVRYFLKKLLNIFLAEKDSRAGDNKWKVISRVKWNKISSSRSDKKYGKRSKIWLLWMNSYKHMNYYIRIKKLKRR